MNSYFTILGEEGIGGPEDHYEQLETLKHANDGELFVTTFSSNPGGSYSGILAWKNALEGTMAHTVAILEGDLASASTIVPLYFDEIHVTPHTTFMIHSANLGIGRGTASNVERNAAFQAKQMERFLRDAYRFFLTEEEIQKVLDRVELYLDDKDIQKRLEIRKELLAEECDCEECSTDEDCVRSGVVLEVSGAQRHSERRTPEDRTVRFNNDLHVSLRASGGVKGSTYESAMAGLQAAFRRKRGD